MLSMAAHDGHQPEIVKTVATRDEGVAPLLAAVEAFRARAQSEGLFQRRRRAQVEHLFDETLRERLMQIVRRRALPAQERERTIEGVLARETDPVSAAARVLERLGLA
jgi:LAO/AO transport system kinase